MLVDVALAPFDADVTKLIAAGCAAEAAGASGVWTTDHFSGAVVGRRWSRDPFVVLGALAQATEHVRVGPLVANVRNRHAAQLASAVNSLASLAPGRTVLGIGSGAAPESSFAVEHEAIGTDLGDDAHRRSLLAAHITAVRALHSVSATGAPAPRGVAADAVSDPRLAVTDGSPCPPIVVGASARATVDVALELADGLNLRSGPRVPELVEHARATRGDSFEISVLVWDDSTAEQLRDLDDLGVDRVIIGVPAERSSDEVAALVSSARAV